MIVMVYPTHMCEVGIFFVKKLSILSPSKTQRNFCCFLDECILPIEKNKGSLTLFQECVCVFAFFKKSQNTFLNIESQCPPTPVDGN
mmetsp:Transcript_42176/g.61624  ORF Transcript_42176/g.61624 Transcript_42176/m.61624 type:complete len:87 (+) Transcript_42176:192-452(+)